MDILLANCRRNNTENNITGLLISYEGSFIQYIEGDEDKLDELFSRIKKDPRHTNCIELTSGLITERQFSNWSMAYRKVDEKKAKEMITGYKSFRKEEVFIENQNYRNHPAMGLLNSFVNNL